MNPAWILIILFAISAALNGVQWRVHDKAVAAEASARQLAADARASAEACNASVRELAAAGEARDRRLAAGLAAIAPAVERRQKAALEALAARPDDTHDVCGSLLRFWQAQLKLERGQLVQ